VNLKRVVVPPAAVAFALAAATGTAAASPAASSSHGCPSGDVCIYPNNSWNGDSPSNTYRDYGVYKIYNQYGTHRVYNHRTDDAAFFTCNDANCNDIAGFYSAGDWEDVNLTPINAVDLEP
jgi:hypothetical protein